MTSPARHCLLIVDDEPSVAESIRDLLRREFHVLTARSAADGYRLMQDNEVHIIMTDQRMPHISGVEMLAKVRVKHPHAVRILFTGYADVEAIVSAINHGHIFQFLRKPWEPEKLETVIREAAAEYDRLVEQAEERERLHEELDSLRRRVANLEAEVARLRATQAGTSAG